ncbi:hypothetical protein SAMN04487911_10610 [Arenibacter nanhaiticus]|uniref:Heavy-metal-associated domain-containing protein n=1 Tax=Arenibacter nanhaiticus TaxID=558155 RepID=A0A1M6E3Y9_9FLAO|nr:hypothetical protein [Arenibacter nanhaiticus]SHI80099.1 hypothetical protein SAMN04487911_10610 [Arenibacter nanhaiticus]
MKTLIQVPDLNSEQCKRIIVRNLSRILDLRILDISVENKTISIRYNHPFTLEKVKKELMRIKHTLHALTDYKESEVSF